MGTVRLALQPSCVQVFVYSLLTPDCARALPVWDCCGYTLENYTAFVTQHLMPVMKRDHPQLQYLAFDHNPDALELWINATFANDETRDWAWGSAVHWYSPEPERGVALNRTHQNYPRKPILHTEVRSLCVASHCVLARPTARRDTHWWPNDLERSLERCKLACL